MTLGGKHLSFFSGNGAWLLSQSAVCSELQHSSASWNRLMDHQGPFCPLPQLLSTSFYSEECVLRYVFQMSLACTEAFAIFKPRNYSEMNMFLRLELSRGV